MSNLTADEPGFKAHSGNPCHTEIEVQSLEHFLELLRVTHEIGTTVWYRGHATADWSLSTVLDRLALRADANGLMEEFRLHGGLRHAAPPSRHDHTAWIVLARHHGLPTALLDWTRSPLTAAFFATLYDARPGPGAIWQLWPQGLNGIHTGTRSLLPIDHKVVTDYLNAIYRPDEETPSGALAILAPDFDQRMVAQGAAFTVHGTSMALNFLDNRIDGGFPWLSKLVLPESVKQELAVFLGSIGVDRSSVFPDLTHLAQQLIEKYSLLDRRRSGRTSTPPNRDPERGQR